MDLEKLLSDQRSRRRDLLQLEKYVLGDQWDDGRGWTGPLPNGADNTIASDLVRRNFVQRNALKEVVTRHRDAVIGREPQWDLTTDTQRGTVKLREETIAAVLDWWDTNTVLGVLQTATARLLYAEEAAQKGEELRPAISPIRLFLRATSVNEAGIIPKRTTLAEALADIAVHACNPTIAGVLRNTDGDVIATRFEYVDEQNRHLIEVTGTGANLAALGLNVDATPDTLIVILANAAIDSQTARLPLAGRLLMHEMRREPLITEGARSQQKLINKTWTMLSHNMDVAGFTERTFLNAQSPGKWVGDDGNPTTPGDGKFVPEPLIVGAGASRHVVGLVEPSHDGTYRYATPSVQYRDPVPPDAFTKTTDAAYRALLEECKQLHVLLSADGNASGASRKQATADYLDSLGLTANAVQGAVRWLLGTTLRLAGVLMGSPDRFDALKPMAQARISVVQPTSEDIKATIAKRGALLISRETAMTEVGIEDPDAELERIEAEQAAEQTTQPEPEPQREPEREEEPPDGP